MHDGNARVLLLDTMLGWTGNHSRSQGEQIVAMLEADGHEVRSASRRPDRIPRLLDMLATIARSSRWADVVSIAVFSGPAFRLADITARLCDRLGLPIVLVLHGGNLPTYAEANPERVRRLLDRADVVVAPSTYNAERLGPYHRGTIEVVDNLVDVDPGDWKPRPSFGPRILWMRALHELYHPELAIEVMSRVVDKQPDASLTMAGPDKAELNQPLQDAIEAAGLADHIELIGFISAEEKTRRFDANDIFLNTSRVDNTPVSLLEAAAHGLVVVSTDAGGIPDLFDDGENALLGPVGGAEELADAIIGLLDEPARAERIAQAGRDLVRSMTWPELGPRWRDVFERARTSRADQTR